MNYYLSFRRGCTLTLQQTRGLLVVFSLVLLLPALGLAQSNDEVRIIQVGPEACNVYGHWISEDGVIEFVYSDGKVYADGWQIHPILTIHDPGPNPPMGDPSFHISPRRSLILGVCVMRDSMYVAGDSPELVVETCIKRLEDSGFVEKGNVNHTSGPNFRIHWASGSPSIMKLGGPAPPPSDAAMKAIKNEGSRVFLVEVTRFLETGKMLVVTAYPLPRALFVPLDMCKETADLLRKAEKAIVPISTENWPKEGLIDYGFAEQIRNPLSISRKEER